jgi:predicted component of type VI protein secretion system
VPSLLIRSGPLAGQRIALDHEVTIGRGEAELSIEDPEVSRRHAEVRPAEGAVEVEDLGSTNGTWVNENRIGGPTRVAQGDIIRIGQSTFEAEAAVAQTTAAPTPPATQTQQVAPGASAVPSASSPPVGAPAAGAYAAPPPPAAAPYAVHEVRADAPGAFAQPPSPRGRSIASRQALATGLSFAAIAITAIALILYFALR